MPVIFVEEKKEVKPGVFKTETKVCNLPDWVMFEGNVLHYDSYHGKYIDREYNVSITPKEYLEYKLMKENKTKNKNEQEK